MDSSYPLSLSFLFKISKSLLISKNVKHSILDFTAGFCPFRYTKFGDKCQGGGNTFVIVASLFGSNCILGMLENLFPFS